jgi:predicted GIY-YIG superfamily endonuclease
MTIHQTGRGSKYVCSRGFNRLLAFKKYNTKSEALKIEYVLKQLPKNKKLEFFG